MHVSGYRTSFVDGWAQSMRRRYHLANCKPRGKRRETGRAAPKTMAAGLLCDAMPQRL
jgi:hypothetical protein